MPYGCGYRRCGFSASLISDLKTHLVKDHGFKMSKLQEDGIQGYTCVGCGWGKNSETGLRNHWRRCHKKGQKGVDQIIIDDED